MLKVKYVTVNEHDVCKLWYDKLLSRSKCLSFTLQTLGFVLIFCHYFHKLMLLSLLELLFVFVIYCLLCEKCASNVLFHIVIVH